MALADVSVYNPMGGMLPSALPYRTEANATAILTGEPVVIGGTGSNYVVPNADATPTTSALMLGITSSDSTQTSTLDGTVNVILAVPGLVFVCKATTPANIDTDAELLAILNDRVAFDLAAGIYTVDENQGDSATNGLRILGGDIVTGDIYFTVQAACTNLN